MPNIVAAIAEPDDDIYDLVSYQEISGHLILNVKLVRTSKGRLGLCQMDIKRILHHLSPILKLFQEIWLEYTFTIVALNNLDILAADIDIAYLIAP